MIKILCKLLGHKWTHPRTYIRICERCEREEAIFENPYPKIGESKLEWKVLHDNNIFRKLL